MTKRSGKRGLPADPSDEAARHGDAAIIHRVLAGDIGAFEALMVRYETMVATRVRYHVPPDAVEETVQEVFLRAYKSLANCRERDRFKAWLAAITVKTCYDQLRRQYRNRETALSTLARDHRDWMEFMLADQSREAYERRLHQEEAKEVLAWALSQLPPKDRMVLELVHLQDHPVKEAARLLGWSASNVKVRAHRSRKKLKTLLAGIMGEDDGIG